MFNNSKKESRTGSRNHLADRGGYRNPRRRAIQRAPARRRQDRGRIRAEASDAVLTLSNHAQVIGEIQAPHIVINGTVTGDVTADERLELASNARVEGNVFYKVLEMSAGAQINGKMVHRAEPPRQLSEPETHGRCAGLNSAAQTRCLNLQPDACSR